MIVGSWWRLAAVVMLLVAPSVAAAPPSPILTSPSSTEGQEVADLAVDPTGQYAMAVVVADAQATSGLPLGGVAQQSKPDVFSCDFGSVLSPRSAQNCVAARHRSEPSTSARLEQTVAGTSFSGGQGLTARYAVGGPANRVSFWSSTEQSSRWETTLPVEEPVLNVSISTNGTRLAAASDAPLNGGSRLFVYDTTGTSARLLWQYNLTDAEGQKPGVEARAMEQARTGRYMVVGTTPASGATNGALLWFDLMDERAPVLSTTHRAAVSGAVRDLALSDDGNAIVVGTTTSVYYWPLPAGLPSTQHVPWSRNPSAEGAQSVAISRDGEWFAAASGDTIHFYRHINTSLTAEEIGSGFKTEAHVSDLSYDAKGRILVAVAGNKVYGFTQNRTEPIWSFDATQAANGALDGPLREVSVSETGERIVVAGRTKVMAYRVAPAASIAIEGSPSIVARPAQTVRVDLRVTNTGSMPDEFTFRATPPAAWASPGVPEPIALLPEPRAGAATAAASKVVSLNVTVPEGQPDGTYRFSVDVHSSFLRNASRETKLATVEFDVVIPRSVALAIEPSEERFSLAKGGERTLPITIRNTGNAGGLVNLTLDQQLTRGSPWTLRLDREQIEIGAGNEETVNLVIDAPVDGASGDKNVIRIIAREGTYQAERFVTAYIDAEFGAELTASNDTLEFTSRAPQTISITVHNTGNTDDTFNLTHQISGSAVNDWTVTVSRPTIDVPRGQTRQVGVTVTPNVAEPRPASLTIRAVSQQSLGGDEGSVAINLVYREPPRDEEDSAFIPGPSPALALGFIVLAAFAARRLRGGRA